MDVTFEERISKLNEAIKASNRIVIFSGAGVSTESGIPDFRSKDGLYNRKDVQFEAYTPEYLLSKSCLLQNSKVFYEFYRQKMDCRGADPNIAHLKVAELERLGKQVSVVTQNIDVLHRKAGSTRVHELHGSIDVNYCCSCKELHSADFIFDCSEDIPRCTKCGGMVRPNVVLYEEGLPDDAWNEAVHDIMEADLVIVCGTSLTVYPAAGLIHLVPSKKLVVINRDPTRQDSRASILFHESLGDVFSCVNC